MVLSHVIVLLFAKHCDCEPTSYITSPMKYVDNPQEGSSRHVTISQAKFCADGCDEPYKDYQWMIPITIATKKNQSAHSFVLDSKQATVTIENVDPSDWVKVCDKGGIYFNRLS